MGAPPGRAITPNAPRKRRGYRKAAMRLDGAMGLISTR